LSDFPQIVTIIAERLRALQIREIVYFHCDHFEPWDFGRQTRESAAETVVQFVDAVQQVDFARRLTLFYSNAWSSQLSDRGDLVRVAPDDRLGFAPRRDADERTLGAPFLYLRGHSAHEVQIHLHHENYTWTRGIDDPERAEYFRRPESRAHDGARMEFAIRQWLLSAGREFDYTPARWFFVHGLWSLNASDPEGCTIEDEIGRLMKLGCRGDFTFPAGRPHCDPGFEAPYFCAPAIGPKSYDSAAAEPEFAWGNGAAAAAKFFIWNSPIKSSAASLDWGEPGLRRKLDDPLPFALEIVARSFRQDGTLFIKTHGHSMHALNRDGEGRLIHPHCYGPIRDLYGAIFDAAATAGATVTFATASEVYDRFVAAPRPATVPPMSALRASVVGDRLGFPGPTSELILDTVAKLNSVATPAMAARIAALGVGGSGAEPHYATLVERGALVPMHDMRAAQILVSLFGARHPVHEIGAGIGMLPMLLAALQIPVLGIERSEARIGACRAVADAVARHWNGPMAAHEFLLGNFPACVKDRDLRHAIAVTTDFTCTMEAEPRRALIRGLRRYGAVLMDLDRFVRRISGTEARRALVDELRALGLGAIYDIEIASDFAFVLIVNDGKRIPVAEAAGRRAGIRWGAAKRLSRWFGHA
jgi:hypothetical protein